MRKRHVLVSAALLAIALLAPSPVLATAAGGESPTSPSAPARPEGIGDAELERMLAPLADPAPAARRAAARALDALGPDAVPAIGSQLAAQRKAQTALVASAVKAARDATGTGPDGDLTEALLAYDGEGAGHRAAITTAALAQALARIGTTPAVQQLVRISGDHGGAFRPLLARHVKALGDKAVPALIGARKESSEVRRWAAAQLEGLGKRIAGDAVQTQDNQVLADVLHAFGAVHDIDALPVILSFVNSDRVLVREAARTAVGELGQDALWKLREAYSNVLGKAAPEGTTARDVAKELFAAYDRLRLQEVHGLLDEGLAKQRDGKLEEAIAAFDKVLARQPMFERRGEMVPGYVAYAESFDEPDPERAIALYRRAARLWPESARVPHIQAQIAYLEGKGLLARGIVDREPFERALEHEPTHDEARAELARMDAKVDERDQRVRLFAAVAAVVLVALSGLLLFGGRRRRALRA